MTDNLKYIISALLTIRAGMSAASCEKDALAVKEKSFTSEDMEYQKKLWELVKKRKELISTLDEIEYENEIVKKRGVHRAYASLIFLIFLLSGGMLILNSSLLLVGCALIVLGIICALLLYYVIIPRGKNYKTPNPTAIAELKSLADGMQAEINKGQAEINSIYPEHRKREATFDNEITMHLLNARDIYESLKEAYGALIPCEYWRYTDIMLYYFGAGRCDEVADCLAMLDELRRSPDLDDSAFKATRDLTANLGKVVSFAKPYINEEFADMSLMLERRSSCFNGYMADKRLYGCLKARRGVPAEELYEDMMQLAELD